jgi:hypothetical protein
VPTDHKKRRRAEEHVSDAPATKHAELDQCQHGTARHAAPDWSNSQSTKKRHRNGTLADIAPSKLARSNGIDHASGQLAQPALQSTIIKVLSRKGGTLSLTKLLKLVRKKHWSAADATSDNVLQEVCVCFQSA